MPIAVVASRGVQTNTAAGFDEAIDLPAGASITVGNTLVLAAAYDNSGTSGVDPNMFVATDNTVNAIAYYDLRNNLWTRIAKAVRDPGNANEGAVVDLWSTHVQFAYANGDDITVQWSFSVAAACLQIVEYSGIKPISYSLVTPISGTGSSATVGPTGTITPTASGQMVMGVAAIEDNVAITDDADVTDGVWVRFSAASANTGVAATSMTLVGNHKIVTGTAAQDWDVTKVGAADYAAIAVVFAEFVNVTDPWVSGNPDYPCIAGPQILPLGTVFLPIDSGSEYLFTHKVFPNSYLTQDYNVNTQLASDPENDSSSTIQQHVMAYDVFLSGDELIEDPVESVVCAVSAAGVSSGASVSSGTAADAIARPGGEYVILPNGGQLDVLFDPSTLTAFYPTHRIARWAIRYLAWKDDGAVATPGEGIQVQWVDLSASNGAGGASPLGAWLTPNYRSGVQYDTRYLGEHNSVIRGKGEIINTELKEGASFTVNDLSHMDSLDQTTRLRIIGLAGPDPSQTTVYLDYIELIVELVPERRLASGHRRVCNAPIVSVAPGQPELYPSGGFDIPMWTALNTNTRWTVPSADNTYVLAVREIQPASPSDFYAVEAASDPDLDRRVGTGESFGPPHFIRGVRNARETLVNRDETGQPKLSRAPLTYGVISAEPTSLDDDFLLGAVAFDAQRYVLDGSFFPGYVLDGFGNLTYVHTGADKTQYILVDGSVTYDRITLLVAPDTYTTADLDISLQQPLANVIATATITVADYEAADELGFGWRAISVPLSIPITPIPGRVVIVASSTTASTAPWRWQFGAPVSLNQAFGYDVDNYATLPTVTDYAVVLQCELEVPDVSLDVLAEEIWRADGRCVEMTTNVPEITVANGTDYDWIAVERTVDGGLSYDPVALVPDPDNDEVIYDFEVPWDYPSGTIEYRVTGYRNADRRSTPTADLPWNFTSTAPGAAFGLASNAAGFIEVYVPSQDSGDLEVPWSPLNPVSLVQLHGIDYQVALRSPEERGLSCTVPIIVDKLGCSATEIAAADFAPETITKGRQAMGPTPFDRLRALETYSRVALKLPGGHTRQVSLDISGSMVVKTARGIYAAEIELTDVIPPEVDPYE